MMIFQLVLLTSKSGYFQVAEKKRMHGLSSPIRIRSPTQMKPQIYKNPKIIIFPTFLEPKSYHLTHKVKQYQIQGFLSLLKLS